MENGHRDIIVVGASAGGVEALRAMVAGLPDDLPAAVFIVLHLPPTTSSSLPSILSRNTSLAVHYPEDGEQIVPGHIYLAPPDRHLLLRQNHLHLSRDPRENGHRPAVDPLFRSAARIYDSRVIGVILSGALDDGAAGLNMIKQQGGIAVVQAPDDAAFAGMPRSALEATSVDIVVPASDIGPVLAELARERVGVQGHPAMDERAADGRNPAVGHVWESGDQSAPPSAFTCPECHGTLFETQDGGATAYACRVGHRFSVQALIDGQSEALEVALWAALRSLEESTDMARRLADRAERNGQPKVAQRFRVRALDGEENAAMLRTVLAGVPDRRDSID